MISHSTKQRKLSFNRIEPEGPVRVANPQTENFYVQTNLRGEV